MVITGAPDLSWIFRNIADDAHNHVQPLRAAAAACRTYAAKIENVPGDCDTIIATGLANWDGPAKDAFLLSWAINFSGTPNDGYSPASFIQLSNEAMAHGAPLQPILPALHSQILDTAGQLEDLASKIEQYVIACKTAQVIDLGLAVLSVVLFILTIEIGGEGGLVAGLFSYLGVDAAATYLAGQLVAWGLGWVVSIAAPIVTNVVMPALELAFISGMINLVSQEVTNALVWDPYRQSIGEPPAGVNWNEVVDAALIGGMSGAVMGGAGGIAGALLKPVMQDASPILRQVITRSLGAVLGGVGDIPVQLTHVFDPNHPRGWDWGEFGSSIGVGALMGGRIGDLFTQRPTLIIDNPDGGTLFMAPEKGLKVDLNSTDLSVIDPTTGRPVSAGRWAFNVIDPETGRIIGHALPGTSNLDDPFLRVVYNDGTVDNYALNGSTVHMFTSGKVGVVDGPATSAKPPDGVPLKTKYDKHVAYSVEGGKARPLFQTEALGDKKIAVSAFDGQGDPHLVEVHEKLTDEIEVQVVDSSLDGPDVVTTIELPKDSWVVYDQNGSVVAATRPMNKVSFDPSPSGPGGVRPSRVDRNSTELYMAGSDRQLRRLGFIRKNPISKKFDFYGDKWRPGDSEGLFTFTGSGFEGMSLRQFPDGLGTTTIAVGETQRFSYDLTGKAEPTFPAPAPKETTGTAAPHSAGRTVDAEEPQQEEQRTLLASAQSEPASTSRLVTPASGEPLKLALPNATAESQTAVTTNDALQTLRRHARTLLQELSDRPPSEGYDLRKALESLRDLVGDLDGHPRKDGLLEALGMMLDDRWGLRNGLNTDPLIKDQLFLPLLRQLADLAPGPHVPRLPDPQGFRFDASASSGSESGDGGLVPEQEEPAAVSPPSTPKPELPANQRVEAMVPGLWEEIDPSSKTVGPWMFKDYGPYRNDDTVSMTTKVTNSEVAGTGTIIRTLNITTGELSYKSEVLKFPDGAHWVRHQREMVPGKGTPLETYITMRQMKRLAKEVGDPELFARPHEVVVRDIANVRTILRLAQLEREWEAEHARMPFDQNRAIETTHSVQYAKNSIAQSGGKVTAVWITGGNAMTAEALIKTQGYTTAAEQTKLLRTYGVAPGDQVLANFAIHIQVEPVSTTPAAASGDVEVLKDLRGSPPAPEIVRPRHPDASRFVYPYDGLIHPAVENGGAPDLLAVVAATKTPGPATPAVRDWLDGVLGFERGGLRLIIDRADVTRGGNMAIGGVFEVDGRRAGWLSVTLVGGANPSLTLNFVGVDSQYQRSGVAARVLGGLEKLAQSQRIRVIRLLADDIGAYVWARHGFVFDQEAFSYRSSGVPEIVQRVQERLRSGRMSPAGRRQWEQLATRATETAWGTDDFVTPEEISRLGWDPDPAAPATGPDGRPTWDGKEILLGSSWHGRRILVSSVRALDTDEAFHLEAPGGSVRPFDVRPTPERLIPYAGMRDGPGREAELDQVGEALQEWHEHGLGELKAGQLDAILTYIDSLLTEADAIAQFKGGELRPIAQRFTKVATSLWDLLYRADAFGSVEAFTPRAGTKAYNRILTARKLVRAELGNYRTRVVARVPLRSRDLPELDEEERDRLDRFLRRATLHYRMEFGYQLAIDLDAQPGEPIWYVVVVRGGSARIGASSVFAHGHPQFDKTEASLIRRPSGLETGAEGDIGDLRNSPYTTGQIVPGDRTRHLVTYHRDRVYDIDRDGTSIRIPDLVGSVRDAVETLMLWKDISAWLPLIDALRDPRRPASWSPDPVTVQRLRSRLDHVRDDRLEPDEAALVNGKRRLLGEQAKAALDRLVSGSKAGPDDRTLINELLNYLRGLARRQQVKARMAQGEVSAHFPSYDPRNPAARRSVEPYRAGGGPSTPHKPEPSAWMSPADAKRWWDELTPAQQDDMVLTHPERVARHDMARIFAGVHGVSPTAATFKGTRFLSDPGAAGPWYMLRLSRPAHQQYFEPGNAALTHIAKIIVGGESPVQDAVDETMPITEVGSGPGGGGRSSITAFLEELKTLPDEDFIARVREFLASLGGSPGDAKQRETVQRIEEFLGLIGEDSAARRVAWDALQQLVDPSSGLPPDLRAQHGLGDQWKPASDLDKRSEDLARERERLRGEEQALTEGVHTLQQEIDQEFADKSAAIHASAEAMLGRIDEIKTKNEDLAAARLARIEAEFRATMEAITQQSVQSAPEVPVDESPNGPVLDPRLTPEELLRQLDQIRTELNQAMQAENAESGPQAAEQEKVVEGSSETVKPPTGNELQQNLSARLVEGGAHVVPSAASPPVVPGARWLPADASLEALEDALTEQQQRLAALDQSEAVFDERNAPLRSIVTALDLFRRISAARDRHLANARQHLDSYDAQALSMPTRRGLDYQDSMRLRQSLLDRWAENAAHDIEEVEFLERVVAWGKRKGRITPEQQAQVDTLFQDFPELDDLPESVVNGLPAGLRGRLFDIRQFVVDAIKVHEYLTRRGLGPLLDGGIDGLYTAHRERLKALDQHILDTRAGIAAQNEALRAARQVQDPVQVAAATAARQALRADLDEALGERRRLDRLVAFYLNEHPERLGAEVAVTDDRVRELRRLLEAAMRTGDTTAVASLSESLGRAIDHLQRLSAQYAIYDLRTRLAQVMEVVRQARTAGDAGRLRTAKKQAHRLRAAVRTLQAVPEAVRAARSLLSELAEIDVALADAEQTANDKVAAAGVDVARVRRIRNAYANREKVLENRRTRLTAAFEDHLRTLQGHGYLQHLLDAALAGDREAAATLLDHERLLRWIEHRRARAAGRTVRPKAEKPHELPIDTRDPVVQQVFRTSQKAIPKMAKYAFYERRREEAMGYEPTVHSLDMRLQEPHPTKAARLGRKMERLRKRIPDLSAVHSYGRYVIEQEDDQRPGVQAVRERVSEAAAPDPLWSADSVDVVVRHIEDGLGPAQRARADFAAERTRRNSYVSALNEVVDAMRAVERLRLAGAAETEVRSQYERLVTARLGLRGWTVVGSEALPVRQSLDGRELPPVPSRADDDPRTWVDEIEEIREIPVNVPFALHHTHRDVFKDGKPLDWVGGDLPIESTIESQKYVVVMKDGAEYEVTEFVHQTLVIRSGSLLEGGLAMARIGGGLTTPLSAFSWAPKHAVGFGPFTLLFQLPFGLNTDLQYIPELRRDFFVYEHVGRKTVKVKRLTDHGDPRKSWKIHTPATGIKLVDDTLKTVQFYVKWGLQAQIVPMVVVKFGDPSTTDGNQLVDLASFGAVGAGQVTGEIAYFRDAATGAFIRMDWTAGVEFLYGLFGGMPDHYGATRLLPDVSPFMNWRPTPSTVPWNRVWTLDIKPLIQHVRDAVLLKVPGLSTVIQRRLDAVNRLQYVGVAGQWAKDRRAYLLLEALKGHDRPSDDEGPQLLVPPSRGPRPKKPTGGPALRSPSGGDLLLPLDPPPTPAQTSRTRPVAGAASKAVEPGPKRAPAPTPPPPSDVPPAVAQLLQVEAKNQAEQARRRVEDALRGGDLVQNAADEILALVKEVESFAALPSDQGLRGIQVTAHADAVRALRHRIGELPPAPGTTGVLRTTPLAPVEDPNGQDGGKLR